MDLQVNSATSTPPLGKALRRWRRTRSMSQMDLALEAQISTRHLSFIETGRSKPSRGVVLQLAHALDLPFRHCNSLLMAAGYAPEYQALSLDDGRMTQVRFALERILQQHEPYPALVVDQAYNILMTNTGYRQAVELFAGSEALEKYSNVYRLMFAHDGLRPYCTNWPFLQAQLLGRLREDAQITQNEALMQLLSELAAKVPETFAQSIEVDAILPVLSLELRKGSLVRRYFSTITTFGTPMDITVQELRIESLFPAE